jgi:hypothetical protein
MQKYRGPDIRFVFYDPNCNHSNEFLFVLNGAAANQYASAITWQKIKKRIKLDCRSVTTTTSTLRQAAGNFADYGFCTSQNSNQKESITGHAMPALKPISTEPEIVGAFVALTSFASNTRPLWMPDNNHFALILPGQPCASYQSQLPEESMGHHPWRGHHLRQWLSEAQPAEFVG